MTELLRSRYEPIEVVGHGGEGRVLKVATLRPTWGLTRWRLRARSTVEAAAGSMAGWGVRAGSRLEIG